MILPGTYLFTKKQISESTRLAKYYLSQNNIKYKLITKNNNNAIVVNNTKTNQPEKLIVLLIGNAEIWQNRIVQISNLSEKTNSGVFSVNYKKLTFSATSAANNIEQLIANELKELNIGWSNVTIIGHSIGAFLGSKIAKSYSDENIGFFNSRSLSTIAKTFQGLTGLPSFITHPLVFITGWGDNSVTNLRNIGKLEYAYSKDDEIINYKTSSFHSEYIKQNKAGSIKTLIGHELFTKSGQPHNTPEEDLFDKAGNSLFDLWVKFSL